MGQAGWKGLSSERGGEGGAETVDSRLKMGCSTGNRHSKKDSVGE